MLSNFQLDNRALLQSFLVGQPELRRVMQSGHLHQLRQRVLALYHLGPMERAETQAYIEHRLKHVGWRGDPGFEPGAFDAIHNASGGIPRRINLLCNRVMLAGYLGEKHALRAADVTGVVNEMRKELGPEDVSNPAGGNGPAAPPPIVGLPVPIGQMRSRERPRQTRGTDHPPGAPAAFDRQPAAHADRTRPPGQVVEEGVMGAHPAMAGPIVCVVGARPNFMKMAPLLAAFARAPGAAARGARAYGAALRRVDERPAVRGPRPAAARPQPRRSARARTPCRPRRSCAASSRSSSTTSRPRSSSWATSTPRSRAAWSLSRRAFRSCTSRPACAASTVRCPRRSTGSSPTRSPTCFTPPSGRPRRTSRARASRPSASGSSAT